MNVVLYSAIYGGVDLPKTQPALGVPQILYTDDVALDAPGWEVRVDPLPDLPSPMLRAKWWKCRPDLAVPHADLTLWVDGSMTILDAGYVEQVLVELGDADVLFTAHPWRSCIFAEFGASLGLPKYDADAMRAQVEAYRGFGHPEGWGLFAAGAIARRNVPAVRELGELWWQECLHRSWQDQLSLPVVVRGIGERLRWRVTDPTRIPWGSWWSIAGHLR